jgi:hypothetical protein
VDDKAVPERGAPSWPARSDANGGRGRNRVQGLLHAQLSGRAECGSRAVRKAASPFARGVIYGISGRRRMVRLQEQKRDAYLSGLAPSKLLDVGRGSGQRMAYFRDLGWNVIGQDIDESTAVLARRTVRTSLRDRCGRLAFQTTSLTRLSWNTSSSTCTNLATCPGSASGH